MLVCTAIAADSGVACIGCTAFVVEEEVGTLVVVAASMAAASVSMVLLALSDFAAYLSCY